jgi:hypothetical protein
MEEHRPLLLIALAIVGFWLVGKILTRSYRQIHRQTAIENRGTKIIDGFHITGLSDSNVEKLMTLIKSKQESDVTTFIAKYRPIFSEMEDYLAKLRQEYELSTPRGLEFATEADKSAAISKLDFIGQPKHMKFNALSQSDLRLLIEYNGKKRRLITREFIEKFGGEKFMHNLKVYSMHCGDIPVTMHVRKDAEHRQTLESLVESGLALQGRKIHLRDRLNVLQFGQLKEMAKELKIEKIFKSREEAASILAEIPGSAVLLAMIYSVDDIFLIKPENINASAVESEWAVMQAYARLVCRSLDEDALSALNI